MAGTYSCYVLFNNRKLHRKSLNVTFHGMKDKNPNALNTRDIDGQRVRRSYWYSRCPDSLNPYIIISSIYWHCLHSKLRKQELFSRNLRRQRQLEKRKQTTTYITKQTLEWTTRQFNKSNIEENIEGSGDSSGEYIELPESSKHLILQDITQRKSLNSSIQMSVDNIILGYVELGSRNVDTDFEVNKENTHEDFMAGNTINQQAVKSAGFGINPEKSYKFISEVKETIEQDFKMYRKKQNSEKKGIEANSSVDSENNVELRGDFDFNAESSGDTETTVESSGESENNVESSGDTETTVESSDDSDTTVESNGDSETTVESSGDSENNVESSGDFEIYSGPSVDLGIESYYHKERELKFSLHGFVGEYNEAKQTNINLKEWNAGLNNTRPEEKNRIGHYRFQILRRRKRNSDNSNRKSSSSTDNYDSSVPSTTDTPENSISYNNDTDNNYTAVMLNTTIDGTTTITSENDKSELATGYRSTEISSHEDTPTTKSPSKDTTKPSKTTVSSTDPSEDNHESCSDICPKSFFGEYGVLAFAISLSLNFLLIYAMLMMIFMPRLLAKRRSRNKNNVGSLIYKKKFSDVEEVAPLTLMSDVTVNEIEFGNGEEIKDLDSPLPRDMETSERTTENEKSLTVSSFLLRQSTSLPTANIPQSEHTSVKGVSETSTYSEMVTPSPVSTEEKHWTGGPGGVSENETDTSLLAAGHSPVTEIPGQDSSQQSTQVGNLNVDISTTPLIEIIDTKETVDV